jgi:4-aminobutyrate aminotransferase
MDTPAVIDLDDRYVSPSTRIPFVPVAVTRGEGAEFLDPEGKRYLDFHSMACITNTGHCHPRVTEAIARQAAELIHCNTAYVYHEQLGLLAERISAVTPGDFAKRVAFGTTGSDANDGALKLVRAATGRPKVLSFLGAYHGNTYGALSLSGVSLEMRRGFGPVVPEIVHLPYPDEYRPPAGVAAGDVSRHCLEVIDRLLGTVAPPEEVAAVFVEPIQGDSGIVVPPEPFIRGLEELRRRHGILIVAEEVQSGLGRSGAWFASEHFSLEPDVLVIGKALGSGLPISAIVARSELMEAWRAPGHVFSVAAGPVCCAAALATLEVIADEDLIGNARRVGERLRSGLEELSGRFEAIGDVRGRGLMLGVDLVRSRDTRERDRDLTAKVIVRCVELGLYLTFLAGSVLRLAPPLIIDEGQADRALGILEQALDDAVHGRVSDEQAGAVTGW